MLICCFFSHPSTRTTCPPEGRPGEICSRSLCRLYSRETTICPVSYQIKTKSPSLLSYGLCSPHCHIRRKRVVISCPSSLSQIVASLPMSSCASAAACEHSKSWPTSTDRTSLHPNFQVRQDTIFLIQTFLIPFQLFRQHKCLWCLCPTHVITLFSCPFRQLPLHLVLTATGDATVVRRWKHTMQCKCFYILNKCMWCLVSDLPSCGYMGGL